MLVFEPRLIGERNRILGEHIHPKIGQDVRRLVMDLRINMIGPREQQHHRPAFGPRLADDLRAFPAHSLFKGLLSSNSAIKRLPRRLSVHAQRREVSFAVLLQQAHIPHRDGGLIQRDAVLSGRIDRALDQLGISAHHRAVVLSIAVGELRILIGDHRVKNAVNARLDQVIDVPVGQFGGEANVFRGDRPGAFFIHPDLGRRGKMDAKSAFHQQGGPEGEVFVQVQHPRDPDHRRAAGPPVPGCGRTTACT